MKNTAFTYFTILQIAAVSLFTGKASAQTVEDPVRHDQVSLATLAERTDGDLDQNGKLNIYECKFIAADIAYAKQAVAALDGNEADKRLVATLDDERTRSLRKAAAYDNLTEPKNDAEQEEFANVRGAQKNPDLDENGKVDEREVSVSRMAQSIAIFTKEMQDKSEASRFAISEYTAEQAVADYNAVKVEVKNYVKAVLIR